MSSPRRQRDDRPPEEGWRPRWWVETTTVSSFTIGLIGFLHELLSDLDRPATLGACVFLMGGGYGLHILERKK